MFYDFLTTTKSFTQQIKQELLDGFHFSIFFKEGQGPPATNHGQCWSGYENETGRMPTFQPSTGEKLLESLVPAFLTKPISSYATCRGPSWDFITVPHFLELLVRSSPCSPPSDFCTYPPNLTTRGTRAGALMNKLLTNLPGAAVLSAQVHSGVLQGRWEDNVSGTLGRIRVCTALLHGQICPFQDSTDGLWQQKARDPDPHKCSLEGCVGEGQSSDSAVHSITSTTSSILFTWPPENTSVCCQALQWSYFWIKLAFRTFTWPGLGLEDHQEIVLGQLVLPEPKEAKPKGEEACSLEDFQGVLFQGYNSLKFHPVISVLGNSRKKSCSTSWVTRIINAGPGASTTTAGRPAACSGVRVMCNPGCTRIFMFSISTSTGTMGRASSRNSAGAAVSPIVPRPCHGTAKSHPSEELPDITTFPPRLLAEQLTLMDAVSSWAFQAVPLAPAGSDNPLPEERPMPRVQFQPHFLPSMGSR
ncbi:hypothetical protein H8959_007042 [Pygathrix nigripes]